MSRRQKRQRQNYDKWAAHGIWIQPTLPIYQNSGLVHFAEPALIEAPAPLHRSECQDEKRISRCAGNPVIQPRARAHRGYVLSLSRRRTLRFLVGTFLQKTLTWNYCHSALRDEGKTAQKDWWEACCAGEVIVTDGRTTNLIHAVECAHAPACVVETIHFPQGADSDIGNDVVLVLTLRTAKLSKTIGGILDGERLEYPVRRVHACFECTQNEVSGILKEAMVQGDDGGGKSDFDINFVYQRDERSFVNMIQVWHGE